MKWLAAAALVIIVVAIVLWRQLDSSDAAVSASRAKTAEAPVAKPLPAEPAIAKVARAPSGSAAPEDVKPADPSTPEKIDPMGDEFFYKVQETVPKKLGMAAAKCYEGIAKRVHRNESVVYDFKVKIKDGLVSITDVKTNRSSIKQPALETCFHQEIARVTWRDDTLPDWEGDDQMTISPERGLKKFMQDNINYVGEPAPDGYDVAPPGQR